MKAHALYDKLGEKADGKGRVINYISELAALWVNSRDEDILKIFQPIVNAEQLKKLLSWWHQRRDLRRLYLFGLTKREIRECRLPTEKIYEKCLTNPFVLVPISMEKCFEILSRQNKIPKDIDVRCGQIVRKISTLMQDRSWTGCPSSNLLGMFSDLLNVLPHLRSEFGVIGELRTVYLEHAHTVETFVAQKIEELLKKNTVTTETPFDCKERESVNFLSKTLTDEQKMAVQGAMDSTLSIITGGAGTGKTTLIGEIVHNCELRNLRPCVGSFTGKAVSRIQEVIKRRFPSTLHRLIWQARQTPKFGLLVIDEGSMVTTELMYNFFQTFPHNYKIVLVGDPHQLQPIGWGSFFDELIKSGRVPIFRLSTIHRLDAIPARKMKTLLPSAGPKGELIASAGPTEELVPSDLPSGSLLPSALPTGELVPSTDNSHSFGRAEGMSPPLNGILINAKALVETDSDLPADFIETDNFQMMEGTVENVYDIVRLLYQQNIPSTQVTIITPYNRELDELNKTVQQIYNESTRSVFDSRGKLWAVSDRVMLLSNIYSIGSYNGEEGTVIDVDPTEIQVRFKDGGAHSFKLEYNNEDEEDPDKYSGPDDELHIGLLSHSFACSIHKVQGSEWPYVIIYIPSHSANATFLDRNMIYTAITRAKRNVWVIGDLTAFRLAARRLPPYRCENLALRLQKMAVNLDSETALGTEPNEVTCYL